MTVMPFRLEQAQFALPSLEVDHRASEANRDPYQIDDISPTAQNVYDLQAAEDDANIQLIRQKLTLRSELTHAVSDFWANKGAIAKQVYETAIEVAPDVAVGYGARWAAKEGLEMVGVVGIPAAVVISAGMEARRQNKILHERGAQALYEHNAVIPEAPQIHNRKEADMPLRAVEAARWLAHQFRYMPEKAVTEMAFETRRREQLLQLVEAGEMTYGNFEEALKMMKDFHVVHHIYQQTGETVDQQKAELADRAHEQYTRIYNHVMSLTPEDEQESLSEKIWNQTRRAAHVSAVKTVAAVSVVKGVKTIGRVLTGAAIFEAVHGVTSFARNAWEAARHASDDVEEFVNQAAHAAPEVVAQVQAQAEHHLESVLTHFSDTAHAATPEPHIDPHMTPEPDGHYAVALDTQHQTTDDATPQPMPTATAAPTVRTVEIIHHEPINSQDVILKYAAGHDSETDRFNDYESNSGYVTQQQTSINTASSVATTEVHTTQVVPHHDTHTEQVAVAPDPTGTYAAPESHTVETTNQINPDTTHHDSAGDTTSSASSTATETAIQTNTHDTEAIPTQVESQPAGDQISAVENHTTNVAVETQPTFVTHTEMRPVEVAIVKEVSDEMCISNLLKEVGFFAQDNFDTDNSASEFAHRVMPHLQDIYHTEGITAEEAEQRFNAVNKMFDQFLSEHPQGSFADMYQWSQEQGNGAFKELDSVVTDKLTITYTEMQEFTVQVPIAPVVETAQVFTEQVPHEAIAVVPAAPEAIIEPTVTDSAPIAPIAPELNPQADNVVTFQVGDNPGHTYVTYDYGTRDGVPMDSYNFYVNDANDIEGAKQLFRNFDHHADKFIVMGDTELGPNDSIAMVECYLNEENAQATVLYEPIHSTSSFAQDNDPTVFFGHSGRFGDFHGGAQPEESLAYRTVGKEENYNVWTPVEGDKTRVFEINGQTLEYRAVAVRIDTEVDNGRISIAQTTQQIEQYAMTQQALALNGSSN